MEFATKIFKYFWLAPELPGISQQIKEKRRLKSI